MLVARASTWLSSKTSAAVATSSGLFTEYVDMFLKGKQEASGWPSADMSTAEKDEYVTEYEKVEGVVLDKEAIKYNSGKRATNKLLLNSFWGKFGESNNHRVHKLWVVGLTF